LRWAPPRSAACARSWCCRPHNLSPRLRGESRGEGTLSSATPVENPPHPAPSAPTSPSKRGGGKTGPSFARLFGLKSRPGFLDRGWGHEGISNRCGGARVRCACRLRRRCRALVGLRGRPERVHGFRPERQPDGGRTSRSSRPRPARSPRRWRRPLARPAIRRARRAGRMAQPGNRPSRHDRPRAGLSVERPDLPRIQPHGVRR